MTIAPVLEDKGAAETFIATIIGNQEIVSCVARNFVCVAGTICGRAIRAINCAEEDLEADGRICRINVEVGSKGQRTELEGALSRLVVNAIGSGTEATFSNERQKLVVKFKAKQVKP